uniref:Putative secreted protein n=1 Tax=Amblyomma triste TaxID=251400 RepID=A0A023G4G8_AMBTT
MGFFYVAAIIFVVLPTTEATGTRDRMPQNWRAPRQPSKALREQIQRCGLNPCMPMYRPSGCPGGCECVVSPFGQRVHFCAIYRKPLPEDAFSASAHRLYDRKAKWTLTQASQRGQVENKPLA